MHLRGCTTGVLTVAALACGFAAPVSGQILDHFNPLSGSENGVHLYGASIAGMYSTGAGSGLGLGVPAGPSIPNDTKMTTLQASAAFGWSRVIDKSSLSINYSPSYVRGIRGLNFDSTNHVASVSLGRKLGTKWSLNASLNGVVSDFNQLLFGRTRYGGITGTPATFDEFAAALLTGRSDNLALTQAVTASPVIGSPETAFQYGGRILSTSAALSAAFAYSSRSSLSISASGARTQLFNRGNNEAQTGNTTTVPRTTTAGLGLNWSYSLTPRTNIGASLSSSRNFSVFQDAYANQAGMSIGRTMSSHWFVQGTMGAGWIKPIRQTFQPTQGAQITYGGGLGYKVYSHSLIASLNRSVSDVYGLGANASETSAGAWTWKRPGQTISVTSGFGYSRLIGKAFPNSRSWNAFASAGKSLNSHLALSVSYSYVRFPTSVLTTDPNLTQSGVSVSLSWSPSVRR